MIGWVRRRSGGLLAVLAAGVVLALLPTPTAQAAASHAQGIADSGAETFGNKLWQGLNVRRVRAIVPYDVALRSQEDERREDFEAWLTKAKEVGASTNVGLARIVGKGEGQAPDEPKYRRAFRAFVAAYGSRVDVIGPWNEPNYLPTDGSRAKLPGGHGYLDDPDGGCNGPNPTVATCGPRLAAHYYRWAAVDCPRCKLAAGEFAGNTRHANYVQKYKLHLGQHRPALWSVHNYGDVIRFQVSGEHRPAELRMFLRELYCTAGNHCIHAKTDWSSGHLWIGATGAYYQLDCSKHKIRCRPGQKVHVLGEVSQCRAAAFINRLSSVDPRITRIYFYTFTDGRGGDNTGIVNTKGKDKRKAYDVVRDRARACR
jgi:hypothetical protein